MPYIKIWVHVVFSTKKREHFLQKEIRDKVIDHIINDARSKNIYLDCINGYTDHLHCLISLGAEQNISKVLNLIKGNSSHWINQNQLTMKKFSWSDEYFAVSICESILESVRKYIWNQEKRHRKKTLSEEYDEFIEKFGFKRSKNVDDDE